MIIAVDFLSFERKKDELKIKKLFELEGHISKKKKEIHISTRILVQEYLIYKFLYLVAIIGLKLKYWLYIYIQE